MCHIPQDLSLLDRDEANLLHRIKKMKWNGSGVADHQRDDQQAETMASVETDTSEKVSTVQEQDIGILKHMNSKFFNQCFFHVPGWWVYELCFDRHLRQFHSKHVPDQQPQVVAEFFLGYAKNQRDKIALKEPEKLDSLLKQYHDGEILVHRNDVDPLSSYVKFQYQSGTTCDITGKPRHAEVRFYCPTNDKLTQTVRKNRRQQMVSAKMSVPGALDDVKVNFVHSIEEPKTCEYIIKVFTDELCQFDGFGPQKMDTESTVRKIRCVRASANEDKESLGLSIKDITVKIKDLLNPLENALLKDPAVRKIVEQHLADLEFDESPYLASDKHHAQEKTTAAFSESDAAIQAHKNTESASQGPPAPAKKEVKEIPTSPTEQSENRNDDDNDDLSDFLLDD